MYRYYLSLSLYIYIYIYIHTHMLFTPRRELPHFRFDLARFDVGQFQPHRLNS